MKLQGHMDKEVSSVTKVILLKYYGISCTSAALTHCFEIISPLPSMICFMIYRGSFFWLYLLHIVQSKVRRCLLFNNIIDVGNDWLYMLVQERS